MKQEVKDVSRARKYRNEYALFQGLTLRRCPRRDWSLGHHHDQTTKRLISNSTITHSTRQVLVLIQVMCRAAAPSLATDLVWVVYRYRPFIVLSF